MLDLEKAMQALYKKYPDKTITSAIDYDSDWFIFAAVEDSEKVDYDCPLYAVSKQSGDIRSYSPVDDLDNYIDAVQNRSIEIG